ncbi:MAG: hypothetical protein HWE20_05435 [Gammaproteobacteria bacterium]|nr:hypothetical protein [Gammaproteobacteria bacterium]
MSAIIVHHSTVTTCALVLLSGCVSTGLEPFNQLQPTEVREVTVDPSLEPLRHAEQMLRKQAYNQAIAYYLAALQSEQTQPDALLGLASSYSLMGQFANADIYFNNYKTLKGPDSAYHNDLGFSLMLRGELAAARATLEQAIAQAPDSPTITNNLRALKMLEADMRPQS